jgi:hypothetical protein
LLICRPVSRRSEPQKIRNWIVDMQEKRDQYSNDPEVCRVIDQCIAQATEWLTPERRAS